MYHPQVVYIDSPDPRPERFRDMVKRGGVVGNVEVIAMNNADKLIPVVSAASIVAKVIRDSIIEELHREYGGISVVAIQVIQGPWHFLGIG